MIAAGVNFKALSEFMGHSDIAITLDRYGHLLPGAGDEAAELLDKYLNDWRAEKARKASLSESSAPLDVPAEFAPKCGPCEYRGPPIYSVLQPL